MKVTSNAKEQHDLNSETFHFLFSKTGKKACFEKPTRGGYRNFKKALKFKGLLSKSRKSY